MSKGVIAGSASEKLANDISKLSGIPLVKKNVCEKSLNGRFPDGEFYARFPERLPEEVYIVQSTYPPNTDSSYMELFLLADVARDYGAKKVTAVIPYLGYARQDHPKQGEVTSVATTSRILKNIGVENVITVDAHFCRGNEWASIYGILMRNLSALETILNYVDRELKIKDYVLIAPDKGVEPMVRKYNGICLKKERIDAKTVKIKVPEMDLKDRDVVLYDDMVAGGNTMKLSLKEIEKLSPRRRIVSTTHPIFLESAFDLSTEADFIIGTDTIPFFKDRILEQEKAHEVSVASLIAEEIK
jgi:ribose-phosphate pyrophosphokinase